MAKYVIMLEDKETAKEISQEMRVNGFEISAIRNGNIYFECCDYESIKSLEEWLIDYKLVPFYMETKKDSPRYIVSAYYLDESYEFVKKAQETVSTRKRAEQLRDYWRREIYNDCTVSVRKINADGLETLIISKQ